MPRCSASACRNMGSHTFPKDPVLRKKWEKATNKENFKASKHSRLCSEHFMDSDYMEVCMSTGLAPSHRYLKKTAVPSIFPKINQDSVVSSARDTPAVTTSFQATCNKKVEVKSEDPAKPEPANHESKATEEIKLRDRSVRLRNRKAFLANRRCSVPQCNSRPSSEVSLHACPNNAAVRNEWAEALRVSYHYVKSMVACSLHFMKIDFIQSKNSGRVLKHNAVPSRNLPYRKNVASIKNKPAKKVVPCKDLERPKTMTDIDAETTEKEVVKEEEFRECRACLRELDDKKSCCNVFQAWAPPWVGMEPTIAEDLAKLANIEISSTDRHSKLLCAPCYQRLLEAATFASDVRNSDLLLRMRFKDEIDMDKVWPKPIQVDKNINGSVFSNPVDVEIKQEVLSDEEYPANAENSFGDNELANLDIKIEPEEFVEPPPMNITINGTISLDQLNSENKAKSNEETEFNQQTQFLETTVKQEPVSEGEQEAEQIFDMPLECLLCMKSFNSVTGLKAHVIAQHSYKTVKRKSAGSVSPEKKHCNKYQCAICRRSFLTSTDLMVHETCHNKHVCYGCRQKFDSFELLSRHRRKCKASINNSIQKLKTLEDVKRPLPEGKIEQLAQNKESKTINTEVDGEMQDVKSEMKDICEVNETSEIRISEMNETSVKNAVIDNKENKSETVYELPEIKPETDVIGADCVKNEEEQEDSDINMKLDLEIHSAKSEIESTLDGTDMQVET